MEGVTGAAPAEFANNLGVPLKESIIFVNNRPVGVATQDHTLYKNLDVEDKASRVFDYHRATIKNFREIVGAMGIDNPDDIRPSSIYRRVDRAKSLTLDEIYVFYKPNYLFNSYTVPY